MRGGVAEFLPEPDKHWRTADVGLTMDGPTWARLALNQIELRPAVDSGEVKIDTGDLATAESLLALFDEFKPGRNLTIATVPH